MGRATSCWVAVLASVAVPLLSVLLFTALVSPVHSLSSLNDAQWGWTPSQLTPPMAGWKEAYLPLRGNHSQMVYMEDGKDPNLIERIVIVLHGHG